MQLLVRTLCLSRGFEQFFGSSLLFSFSVTVLIYECMETPSGPAVELNGCLAMLPLCEAVAVMCEYHKVAVHIFVT